MKENTLTIRIKRPIKEVFEYTVNPANTHKWITFIEKEWIEGDEIEKGVVYKNTSNTGTISTYLLAEYQPNELFELHAEGSDFKVRYTYRVISDNETELEYKEWDTQELIDPFSLTYLSNLKETLDNPYLRYLSMPETGLKTETKSAYIAALLDARKSSGRSEFSGAIKDRQSAGSWSGALLYMVLIDHIGGMFGLLTKTANAKNDFERALELFTELSSKEREALYALRCSFAHEYFLFNTSKERPSLNHKFRVSAGDDKLLVFPSEPWGGDFDSSETTQCDLIHLGGLVENIHQHLIRLAKENKLLIRDTSKARGMFKYRIQYRY